MLAYRGDGGYSIGIGDLERIKRAAALEQIAAVSMPSRPDMISVLEDQGYRVTAPRRSIVNLLDGKEGGFTVEDITCELPKVGRATVYRTIKLLMDAGVVCKVALPDGTPKYSLARIEHHHHTVCVSCGNVGEFSAAMIEALIRSIGKDMAGEIVGHRMEFHIVCEGCAETEGCADTEGRAETEGCADTEDCAETEGRAETEGCAETEACADVRD